MTESSTVPWSTQEEWAWYFEQAEYMLCRVDDPSFGKPKPATTGPRRLSDQELHERVKTEWRRRNPDASRMMSFWPGMDDALEDEIEVQAEAEYQAALAVAGLLDLDPDMGR